MLAAYFAFCSFGCASSRGASEDISEDTGRAGTGATSTMNTAAADSGSDCRGPGRYESGKEGSYRPCCDGLTEVPVAKSAYAGTATDPNAREPVCTSDLPLNVYACVRGTCGDGVCEEEGEAPACGCVEDCPQAAFARADTVRLAQLSGAPASCAQADLLAQLLPADAQDCGDLSLGARQEERDQSYECARRALSERRAFHVFWRVQGIDTVLHRGFIGRFAGDKRELFRLDVDADWYGIDIMGAVASWTRCEIPPTNVSCEDGPAECFGCTPIDDPLTCGCLPEGPRPGDGAGSTVELRCKPYGT